LVEEYKCAENTWLVGLYRLKEKWCPLFARMFSLVAFYRSKEVSRQMVLCQREPMLLVVCLIFTIYSMTLLFSGGLRRMMRM